MNKLLIVLLAVCLVSVHAFVKRDAETPQPDPLAKIQEQIAEATKTVNQKFSEFFNPEQMKKGLNDVVDKFNEAVNQLNPKKEEAKQ